VEEALHEGKLKVRGLPRQAGPRGRFPAVETVIHGREPKGGGPFLNGGRSGHQPGQLSTIYFLPTHSLELVSCGVEIAMHKG